MFGNADCLPPQLQVCDKSVLSNETNEAVASAWEGQARNVALRSNSIVGKPSWSSVMASGSQPAGVPCTVGMFVLGM